MKLRLTSSDLSRKNTFITNQETGERLERVEKVEFLIDADGENKVVITMKEMEIDVTIPDAEQYCKVTTDPIH